MTEPCPCPCCGKQPTVEQRILFDTERMRPPTKKWVVHCCACPGHGTRAPAADRDTAVAEWNEAYGAA